MSKWPYWNDVFRTFREKWPPEIAALSFRDDYYRLSMDEIDCLLANYPEMGFPSPCNVSHILKLCNFIISKSFQGTGCYCKLGSRGPKDSDYGLRKGFLVLHAFEMFKIFMTSERIRDDLALYKNEGYEGYIWFREWMDFEPWQEFRVFVKDGEILGISQYDYFNYYPELIEAKDKIEEFIMYFYNKHLGKVEYLDTYIFDVIVKEITENTLFNNVGFYDKVDIKLIEINPFLPITDPCLFRDCIEPMQSINYDKFDRSFRIVEEPTKNQIEREKFRKEMRDGRQDDGL